MATLKGTTMFKWGITAESGCLMQSFSRDVTSKKKPIADAVGDTVAKSYYDFSASYSISAYAVGASLSGIVNSDVAATVTLTGPSSGHGVTAGRIICEDVSHKESNEDYALIDLELMQHNALT